MVLFYTIAGGFGLGAAALAFALWQLMKKAKKVEALEADNDLLKKEIAVLRGTQDIFTRPRGDKPSVVGKL